ncbi:hypothetical protein [Nocardioides lijunqiniae]|uniref:hypothetical protein n=1 Tax=Nocardioides lijunqiniae TaxID=2760832 RepID=UPI0018789D6A|nr:hypothetical protein [Nocardioides lijunqiniae]
MTDSARGSRPFVLGLVGGIVVLALLFAFTVLLPKSGGGEPDALPDSLPGGLRASDVARDQDSAEQQGRAEDFAERQRGVNESGAEQLEELFDAPAAVRTYQDEQFQRQATITVVETGAGPFLPNGPPFDPAFVDLERNVSDLVKVGDGVCALYYQQPVPEGQDVPADQDQPQALQCQLGADGATYQLFGRGLDADEAVEILEGLAD